MIKLNLFYDKIVEFESTSDELGFCIGAKLRDLFEDINNPDRWERLKSEILESVKVSFFSKKTKIYRAGHYY